MTGWQKFRQFVRIAIFLWAGALVWLQGTEIAVLRNTREFLAWEVGRVVVDCRALVEQDRELVRPKGH